MPKVICTLPNASDHINGVRFISHALGMVSEEITDEQASRFASIDGYQLAGDRGRGLDPPDATDTAQLLKSIKDACGFTATQAGPTEADLSKFVGQMQAKYGKDESASKAPLRKNDGKPSGKAGDTLAAPIIPATPVTAAPPPGSATGESPPAGNDLL